MANLWGEYCNKFGIMWNLLYFLQPLHRVIFDAGGYRRTVATSKAIWEGDRMSGLGLPLGFNRQMSRCDPMGQTARFLMIVHLIFWRHIHTYTNYIAIPHTYYHYVLSFFSLSLFHCVFLMKETPQKNFFFMEWDYKIRFRKNLN